VTLQAALSRDCEACGKQFQPFQTFQRVCAKAACAKRFVDRKKKDAERRERESVKLRRDALKTLGDWTKEAQIAFNAWIRERDRALPCVSCGDALLVRGKAFRPDLYHAGHYMTTGARPELRFDPANVHKQCAQCNLHLHGNTALFRLALLERIGQAEVDRLEGPQEPKRYRPDDLKAIRDEYRAQLKALQKAAA
jgi:hypothetical protein